jgi:hypothetical protein
VISDSGAIEFEFNLNKNNSYLDYVSNCGELQEICALQEWKFAIAQISVLFAIL